MELKPGYKQTEVGVVPEDWDVVLLDSVALRASGHTPDKTHPEYWGGDIKWVSLADSQRLDNLYISETAATITPEGIANSSANLLPAGSCIVSRDAGVGKSAILAEPMAVSQHFMAWNCGPRLSNHYLYFLLQAMKPELERIAIGNTIKTIGLPYFKALRIQLPSIEEQNSIASALTDIDQFIRRLERSIAKKQGIKQAAIQDLLTGRRRLPGFEGEWEVKRLGEIGSTFGGLTGKTKSDFGNGDAHYVSFMNVMVNVEVDCEFFERVRVAPNESQNRVLRGDLLFNGSSETPDEVAMCSLLTKDVSDLYLNSFCFGYRLRADAPVNGLFLTYLIRSNVGREVIKSLAQGSTRYNLSKRALLCAGIRLPAIGEQIAIAASLSEMDAELAALVIRHDKARSLKQGMMQQLLTGKIRLI
jgi:type I restriction enzyme S subunit